MLSRRPAGWSDWPYIMSAVRKPRSRRPGATVLSPSAGRALQVLCDHGVVVGEVLCPEADKRVILAFRLMTSTGGCAFRYARRSVEAEPDVVAFLTQPCPSEVDGSGLIRAAFELLYEVHDEQRREKSRG